MTPDEAAKLLADTMNEIEAAGYLLYPHPRPVGISIRVLRIGYPCATHPEHTLTVSQIWDQGDGKGWMVK